MLLVWGMHFENHWLEGLSPTLERSHSWQKLRCLLKCWGILPQPLVYPHPQLMCAFLFFSRVYVKRKVEPFYPSPGYWAVKLWSRALRPFQVSSAGLHHTLAHRESYAAMSFSVVGWKGGNLWEEKVIQTKAGQPETLEERKGNSWGTSLDVYNPGGPSSCLSSFYHQAFWTFSPSSLLETIFQATVVTCHWWQPYPTVRKVMCGWDGQSRFYQQQAETILTALNKHPWEPYCTWWLGSFCSHITLFYFS